MADSNRMREQLKEITERLEQGIKEVFESDKYKEYLNTMSKFYNYSFNNTMLIAMQKPESTLIAGYQAWQKKFDRHVMRGEKGIRIIAPAPIVRKEEMEKLDPVTQEPVLDDNGRPVMEEVEIRMPTFKVIPVFDVSQTEGKELPDMTVDELTGNVENFETFIQALAEVAPVPVGYEEMADGAKGYYHLEEKRIAIQEGMSEVQTTKTAIHEISHATLHDIDLKDTELPMEARKDRKTREVEAESIAYTVCQHYGIDTSDYSFGYVAGWSSDKDLKELRSSLETIRRTSATLINAIDEKVAELQLAKEQALEGQISLGLETVESMGETLKSREENPSDREAMLLYGETDSFGIYQLKEGDDLHFHRFESLESLERHGLDVEKGNYELIYTAPLKEGQTLDDIFEEFNLFRPEDFTGHSLSVSDIVLLHKNGENAAQYVDSFGFKEVPDFLEKVQVLETDMDREPPLPVREVGQIGLGDMVFLYAGGKAVAIAEWQEVNHASWRKDMKGLDASDGELVRFNANEIEGIQFGDGRKAERNEEPFIRGFYVIDDIQARLYKIQRYGTYQEAKDAYFALPSDKWKALGVENTRKGSFDFIQCRYGVDTPILDCKKVDGWNNPEVYGLMEQIQWDLLTNRRTEIAYVYDDKYISMQECEDGYDYSIYDKDYKLLDGGILDNPDLALWEAAREILDPEGQYTGGLRAIDYGDLEEKTELANRIGQVQEVPEKSLNNMTRSGIEETVLAYAQSMADVNGYDVDVMAAKVYGSRTAGIERPDSDIDVVIAYKGNIREDDFFNMLHEDGITIGGMEVDINPIMEERYGGIEEYLARANAYLEEKVKNAREVRSDKEKIEVVAGEPAQTLTFYVAECMEYTSLGEYHENLTLDEAVLVYESIPPERMNGIKGIGFALHTEGNEDYMDSTFGLLTGNTIDVDTLNYIQEFHENPLVQQAVRDIIERFPDAEVLDMETMDVGEEPMEEAETETEPMKRMDDLAEKNPLAKVEELEEANYNQIDNVLSNPKPKEPVQNDTKELSIMERLERNKENTARQNQDGKTQKETDKKPERGMD